MDERMLKAGGASKRPELLGTGGASMGIAASSPIIKKQFEDMTLKDRTKMTKEEEYKGKYGDLNQAENLLKSKQKNQTAKKGQ